MKTLPRKWHLIIFCVKNDYYQGRFLESIEQKH